MISCPSGDELLSLLDGEVTENRAIELRQHLAGCPACAREARAGEDLVARLAAPVPGVPSPRAVERVMRRVAAEPSAPSRRRSWRLAFPAGALALAAAAGWILVALIHRPDPPAFLPRGAPAAWERKVGVEIWTLEKPPRRLAEGLAVSPATEYVATYRNLTGGAAYLLAFALDAAGEVHWLYPAFLDASADPPSSPLAPSASATLPDSIELDGVAPGELRLFTIVSPTPLSVSQIERLGRADLDAAALRQRFLGARVETLRLRVEAATRVP
jgi:hypothetical protein